MFLIYFPCGLLCFICCVYQDSGLYINSTLEWVSTLSCLTTLYPDEDEMVGCHHWLNRDEFEQAPGIGDGQASLVCCSPWGHKESDTTEQLSWTELILMTVKPYLQLRFLPCWGLWVAMFQFEWKLTCHHLPMCPAPPPLLLIHILSWWLVFPSAQSST